jgi:hypothetical protein
VVLRLLRGEKLEEVSREVGAEAHRLAAWRNEFLDAGKDGPKGRRATTEEDRRLRDAERKIGKLTLENKIRKKVAEKRGSRCRQKRPRWAPRWRFPWLPSVGSPKRPGPPSITAGLDQHSQQRLPAGLPRDTCAADPTVDSFLWGPPQNEVFTRAGQLHLTLAPITRTRVVAEPWLASSHLPRSGGYR